MHNYLKNMVYNRSETEKENQTQKPSAYAKWFLFEMREK